MAIWMGSNAKYGGIRYLKKGMPWAWTCMLAADLIENRYTLKKNEITLNGLVLGAEEHISF